MGDLAFWCFFFVAVGAAFMGGYLLGWQAGWKEQQLIAALAKTEDKT
jgi:hypothetical protein